MLGTLGRLFVHSSCSTLSFGALRLERRDSAPGLFSEVPTVLTAVVIGCDPLFGGTGGFEDECRRWWDPEVRDGATMGGVAGRDDSEGDLQLRATRRRELLSIWMCEC